MSFIASPEIPSKVFSRRNCPSQTSFAPSGNGVVKTNLRNAGSTEGLNRFPSGLGAVVDTVKRLDSATDFLEISSQFYLGLSLQFTEKFFDCQAFGLGAEIEHDAMTQNRQNQSVDIFGGGIAASMKQRPGFSG